ncbi:MULTISPECIES: hypothetical protein [Legionella]|uniref:hypothetical protein n=1 Tax=Legionella TaxID=445 RepID=UPI0007308DFA|nr:hypothetical protein [Legionella maceachernii]
MKSIAKLEAKVKLAKKNEKEHRHYFARLIGQHQYFLVAMLLPAFLGGWQSGKLARSGSRLKQLTKYGFFTFFNLIKNYKKLI